MANRQASGGIGLGAFSRDSHQPPIRDGTPTFNASFANPIPDRGGLHRQPRGLGRPAPNLISRFPKPLFQPGNQTALTTLVASPTAGQTRTDSVAGTTPVPVGAPGGNKSLEKH